MPFKEEVARLIEAEFHQLSFRKPSNGMYQNMVDAIEKPLIECVMRACKGNQSRAADVMGINRNTLRKKMREHNFLLIDFVVDDGKFYRQSERTNYS